ncbi:murein transglycosylase A [Marinomonas agarivorans]|nr:murein transglycosylase A [Marinomonas agarivorans]
MPFAFSSTKLAFSSTKIVFISILILLISACGRQEVHHSNDFDNNGRNKEARQRTALYLAERIRPGLIYPDEAFADGLKQHTRFLSRKKPEEIHTLETLSVSNAQLSEVIDNLTFWLQNPTEDHHLRAYQLRGDDNRGNVQITGYYVPVIQVRKTPDAEFKYPLYRKPKRLAGQSFPSRDDIDFEGALANQGLEIAYSNSLIENFFLQVQGSGVIQYEDGHKALLSWGGVNGHEYRSLGKVLIEKGEIPKEKMSAQAIKDWLIANPDRQREILSQNPSYLFFLEGNDKPIGAANVPLTPQYSIAVDPRVIPLGATLLGELPVLNDAGELIEHRYQLLLAQDKGGAIKGAGHIDWYQGIGEDAHDYASHLKHYGRIWLLLPDNYMPPDSEEIIGQPTAPQN